MAGKYKNTKTTVNGIEFDSKKEAKRYQDLLLLERAGVIRNLMLQQVFVIVPSVILDGRKKPAVKYKADFTYFDDAKGGRFVVEDVKGFRTPVYRLKRQLMMSVHGFEVLET